MPLPEQTVTYQGQSSWKKWIFVGIVLIVGIIAYNYFSAKRVITVVGVGTERITANKATVTFAYSISSANKDEAITSGEAGFNQLLTSVSNVKPSDIKRIAYQVQPRLNTSSAATEYLYVSGASVTVSGTENINSLLKILANSSIQNTAINYLPEKEEETNQKVQELALKDARKKAENIARASGGRVGKVLAVSEQGSNSQSGTAVTSVQNDALQQVEIQSAMSVTFELW